MGARVRWRPALAALLGALAVVAATVGGVQAAGPGATPTAGAPAPQRSLLPGASDPDAVAPPAGATVRPPRFAPSAVVPSGRAGSPDPPHHVGDGFDPGDPAYQGADDPGSAAGRAPTSGETQFEWGCRRGYIAEGC